MKKAINIILIVILCLIMTSCGEKKAVFAGTDLTPWLEEREGTDVYFTIDTGGAFGIDGIPGPYDIVPLLLEIDIGEKLDYTYEDISQLKNTNGEYMLALENQNAKQRLVMYNFYEDFQVIRINEDNVGVFYRITGAEKLKEYYINKNQYISPEDYARLKKLIDNYIATGEITDRMSGEKVVIPAGSYISDDFRINIYGLKESPSYEVSTYIISGESQMRARIRVLVDSDGNMKIDDFFTYSLYL